MLGKFRGLSRGFVTVMDSRNRRFLFAEVVPSRMYGVDSAYAAAQTIRTIKPSQVMLEMDEPRYQAAMESIVNESQMSAPSRVDVISTVQGGLLTRELKSAAEAAREIDASICLVDRPYRITQNRLAEKVLNPYVFSNLFVYGKMSLMNIADSKSASVDQLEKFLKSDALPIYKVLIEERAQYMARLIHEQAKDGETVVIVCSKMHVPIIESLLSDPDIEDRLARSVNMSEISRKGLPLWPVLVGLYFVLPISLMVYVWTLIVSGMVGAVKKIVA